MIAFALRLIDLLTSRGSPFHAPLLLDPKYYHAWALRIAAGDLVGDGVFYGLPLYPYFLALWYVLVGPSLVGVKLLQALLAVVAVYLTYRIGDRFAGRATGLLAAALAAVYGPLVFAGGLLIPEALAVPLYAAALLVALEMLDRPSIGCGALLGTLIGLAALTKAGIMLFAVAFAAFAIRRCGRRPILTMLLAFAATLAPVALHNRIWGHDTVLLTSHGGFNFYVGNNPAAVGVFVPPAGTGTSIDAQIADTRAVAEAAAGRSLTASEVSRYWSDRAWTFIRSEPMVFTRLALRKLLLVLDARELPDVGDYAITGEFDPFFAVPWPTFAVVGPFVILGLVVAYRAARDAWVAYLWTGTYVAGVIMFFVNARYRLPLISLWLVLAALALVTL